MDDQVTNDHNMANPQHDHIDDPFMGSGSEYLGAGENSLFSGGFLNNPVPDTLIDPTLGGNPTTAQESTSAGPADPPPQGPYTSPSLILQGLEGLEDDVAPLSLTDQQPGPGVQTQSALTPQQASPRQGQANTHYTTAGQGDNSFGLSTNAWGMPQTPALGSQQYGVPQNWMTGAQTFAAPAMNYPVFNPMQHMSVPMSSYPPPPPLAAPSLPAPALAPAPAPPQSAPESTAQPVETVRKLTHNRNQKWRQTNDPEVFYTKPEGLAPWGPMVQDRQPHPLFEYSRRTAELKPAVTYSREELITFFRGEGHPNPNRHLTLWIQNTPAQSNDRYANRASSAKCRYKDCPANGNTILKGWFRVAFDEFGNLTGSRLDPFHNAGYMHLHCFETAFDLGYLIHYGAAALGFTIRADTREFQHEARNPASIVRDHLEMSAAYDEWVRSQKARADNIWMQNLRLPPSQRYTGLNLAQPPPHAERLGRALTDTHLRHEVSGRARNRQQRGGANIERHRGDLDEFNRLRKREQDRKRQSALRAAQEEEDSDEDEESEGSSAAATHQSRRTESRQSSPGEGPSTKRKREPEGSTSSRQSSPGEGPSTKRARHEGSPPGGFGHHSGASEDSDSSFDYGQWVNQDMFDTPRVSPQPQTQTQTTIGPRTRKRSRETGETIVDMLTSQPHLTRSAAHQVQAQLGDVPQHVQDQVLAAVPGYAAPLLMPTTSAARNNNNSNELYNDELEQRLGRLTKRQRREVDEFVQKRELRRDKKAQSI